MTTISPEFEDCGDEYSSSCEETTLPRRKKPKIVVDVSHNFLAVVYPEPKQDNLRINNQGDKNQEQISFLEDPNDLIDSICSDDVQLAVWRRSKLPGFIHKLSDPSLDPSLLPSYYGKVTPTTVAGLMREKLLSTTITAESQEEKKSKKVSLSNSYLEELIENVEQMVDIFDSIVGEDSVHVRLECLTDNGCAFWHQDTVPIRMVATYRGPCTEYVLPEVSQETLSNRQHDSKHAKSLTHHDVALFKGREFVEEEGMDDEEDDPDVVIAASGIVHRSPRIEATGVVRLVLVLDIPADFHENSSSENEDTEEEDENETGK